MSRVVLTEESFVRQLPLNARAKLAEQLDYSNMWERLAGVIPTKPDDIFNALDRDFDARYSLAQMTTLGRSDSGTRALLKDWGMQNCKIKHLVEALYKAQLIAAAVYLQKDVLHTEPRRHGPDVNGTIISVGGIHIESPDNKVNEINTQSPATLGERVPVPSEETSLQSEACRSDGQRMITNLPTSDHIKENTVMVKSEEHNTSVHTIDTSTDSQGTQDFDELKHFPISLLRTITNNFDQRSITDGGRLVGQGGFGTVFFGTLKAGCNVAVKCLKDSSEDSFAQFKTEVEALAVFKHENLVQLLGYSIAEDGICCLVYGYMSNGSLEERLAFRNDTEPLSNEVRLEILQGTAAGLAFLHKGGLVHRDVKSANILLDDTFKPKVGDFATARALPSGMKTQIIQASTVIGTMAYLAPEALSFVIHPSLDSFSFGVVILEVLTGLPVTDPNREEVDIKIYVQEHCCEDEDDEEPGTIFDLLDSRGGIWAKPIVECLYSLSYRCLNQAHRKRPTMDGILAELQQFN